MLAPELLRDALDVKLPKFTEARIDSADLTNVQPAEYRADLVVLLLDGKPVLGIVLEVQLSAENRKRFVWPAYAATLRSRWECPVCVLVVMWIPEGRADRARSPSCHRQPRPRSVESVLDLIDKHLSEAAQRALQAMDLRKYEYQGEFARRYVAEGEAKGRAALVTKLLTRRFGPLTQDLETRIGEASIAELDEIAERLLTAQTVREALGLP